LIKIFKRFVADLLLLAVLAGCTSAATPSTHALEEPNSFTANLLSLDSKPDQLTEIYGLNPTWESGSVWAVQYAIEQNRVYAAYGDDGRVVEWGLDTRKVLVIHKSGIASQQGLQFSDDSKLILGPTGQIAEKSQYTERFNNFISGIAIWSVQTGDLVKCLSNPCHQVPSKHSGEEIGAIMDTPGTHVILYSEFGLNVLDLTDKIPPQGILINGPDSEYWWNIGRVAFDSFHQRYVIICQEGRIEMASIAPPRNGFFRGVDVLIEGKKNELSDIPAAVFDPSGSWLAFIRGDQLAIWKIGGHSGDLFLEDRINTAFDLLFDKTGRFLFIASKDKIDVLDVDRKIMAAGYSTPKITAFDISEDNRLLIWGDENGILHVLGIPMPK